MAQADLVLEEVTVARANPVRAKGRGSSPRRADAAPDPPPSGSEASEERGAKWVARRNAIIDTSAKVFAERGYHTTSTVELCEANHIGKGALYYYIGSKEQLLVAIHDRVMDEVMLGADRVAGTGGSPPAQLAKLGEELLDVIHRYPDHVWVFLHEFPALTGQNAERFRRRRREYEERIESVFKQGSKSGHFRQLDARTAAIAWLGDAVPVAVELAHGGA